MKKVLTNKSDEKGFEIRLILYSEHEIWRQVKIPGDINFLQLHLLIQKLFGFDDYHMWEFKVPTEIPDEDAVDLNNIVETIHYSEAMNVDIEKYLDEHDILLYEYDFGASWEIIIHKIDRINYKNKTALIVDYKGKYNPIEDTNIMVFDEIIEVSENREELKYILDDYGLKLSDLRNFEKKYEKGSRIRLS